GRREQRPCASACLKDEDVGRSGSPVVNQLAYMGRIDIGYFGQRRRHKRRAPMLTDQFGHLLPHAAFKNGDRLAFHAPPDVPWLGTQWTSDAPPSSRAMAASPGERPSAAAADGARRLEAVPLWARIQDSTA